MAEHPSLASAAARGVVVIRHEELARLIPHTGAMCLIDSVVSWDQDAIRCQTTQHRSPANPLRSRGRLGAACGIEFAAQAMAAHGRLCAGPGGRPQHGYLASLRQVDCRCERLDTFAGDLIIDVERLAGDERQALYAFVLRSADVELLSGRATVILEADAG